MEELQFVGHWKSGGPVQSGYYSMVVYTCKKCGEPNFLTPHAFWNITDFGAKC